MSNRLFTKLCSHLNPIKSRSNQLIQIRKSSNVSPFVLRGERRIGTPGYFLLVMPVSAFALGTWQIKRLMWKNDLVKELEEKQRQPPIDFPDDINELKDKEYIRIKIKGRFDHANETFIGPRTLLAEDSADGSLLSTPSKSGYWVITPFKIQDRDIKVLVNRGWIPKANMNPKLREEGQIEDVELVGTIRKQENRPPLGFKQDVRNNQWFYRDVNGIAELLGTSPIFIDADESSSIPGGPVGGQTKVTLRNEHFQYILTWYSVSAITFYLWYKNIFRASKSVIRFK